MIKFVVWLFMYLSLVSCVSAALAENAASHFLGQFGRWRAYRFMEHNQPVCYMTDTRIFAHERAFKRGAAHLIVTHRPGENSRDVVSYSPGYVLRTTGDVKVMAGSSTFTLFADRDSAWARTPRIDHAITSALLSSHSVSIVGLPAQRGIPKQLDQIDVTGARAAYQAIGQACGMEPPPARTRPGQAKKRH